MKFIDVVFRMLQTTEKALSVELLGRLWCMDQESTTINNTVEMAFGELPTDTLADIGLVRHTLLCCDDISCENSFDEIVTRVWIRFPMDIMSNSVQDQLDALRTRPRRARCPICESTTPSVAHSYRGWKWMIVENIGCKDPANAWFLEVDRLVTVGGREYKLVAITFSQSDRNVPECVLVIDGHAQPDPKTSTYNFLIYKQC
ncbi:unnamed protein product [Caenorhabditis sp. 36 PRJEB53466]|nr:unnamed protein product [Caenorhabditis sp. 36 PRJEB53466]